MMLQKIRYLLPLAFAYTGAGLITVYFVLRFDNRYAALFEIAGLLLMIAAIVFFATERIGQLVVSQIQEMGAFSRAELSETRLLPASSIAWEFRQIFKTALSIRISLTGRAFEELFPAFLELFDETRRFRSDIRILIGFDQDSSEAEPSHKLTDVDVLVNAISKRAQANAEIRTTSFPIDSLALTEDWLVLLLAPRVASRESLLLKFKASSAFAEAYGRSFHLHWETAKPLTVDHS